MKKLTKRFLKEMEEDIAEEKWHAELYDLYDNNASLRKLADNMHHAGLMSGTACLGCIKMAARHLKLIP